MTSAAGAASSSPSRCSQSIGRWRGFGGETNFNGECFETYTWAAGLAQATERIMVFATSHVPVIHPIVAAKQAVTIDHISGGRFGLNIVMGWFKPEMEMFGRGAARARRALPGRRRVVVHRQALVERGGAVQLRWRVLHHR